MTAAARSAGSLVGKRVLITGVSTKRSIAYAVAREAQEAGAEIVLTSFDRMRAVTERTARRLPTPVDVLELDVTDEGHLRRVADELDQRWGRLDGVVHAVAYAPPEAMSGDLGSTPPELACGTFNASTVSLARLAAALRGLMRDNRRSSLVSLSFDSSVAWPSYDWMGVSKAALEAASRYLARDLGSDGIRVNSVSAGPVLTVAASQIPAFTAIADAFTERAPLGWDRSDARPVAGVVCFLLSDWSRGMTGQTLHVDGGCSAIGLAPEA
ncbi:MAG: enoyl-ACP reductase FabI [Solirubrobacterales bacterium]